MALAVSIVGTVHSVAQVQASLSQRLPEARAFPGNVAADLYVDEARGEVLVLSVWQTSADADAYFAWRAESGELQHFHDLFLERPISRRYELAATSPGADPGGAFT